MLATQSAPVTSRLVGLSTSKIHSVDKLLMHNGLARRAFFFSLSEILVLNSAIALAVWG